MMNIKHIGYSSFLIELDTCYLLFDYYIGEIPVLDNNKKISVFSSHHHWDHFNIEIFDLLKDYKDVDYIFSRDINRKFNKKFFLSHGINEDTYESITFIPSNSNTTLNDMKIETLRSTDEGVAFIVEIEEKTIYHAGDLNWWFWEEEGKQYNDFMTRRFKHEIEKIKSRHFDVAFLVLDSRQEKDFYLGFDYFMKNTDTDIAYPMHYWNDSSVIEKLIAMPCSEDYRYKIRKESDLSDSFPIQ